MDEEQINNLLKPVEGVLNTLKNSTEARKKYGQELGARVNDVAEALEILQDLTKGVAKLQTDVQQAQDSVQAATASGASELAAKVKELQGKFAKEKAELAKANGEKVTAARKDVVDKFAPILTAIGQQKENVDNLIDDLDNVGFSSEITKLTQGIKDLNDLFKGKGSGSGSGSGANVAQLREKFEKTKDTGHEAEKNIHGTKWSRAINDANGQLYYYNTQVSEKGMNLDDGRIPSSLREKEKAYLARTSNVLSAFRGGGRRRTRKRRGGFRYGVPKSARTRTLRSVLSLKSKTKKSTKSKHSAKGRRGRRRRTKRKKRRR
tara:strand:+ start:727 stop:1686 length:960 start_codon:yes stop_codon:yes gene_type:complete